MCKVYTGYCGTSEIEHGLCACTVDNPLAKARRLSLRTGAQPMLYLPLVVEVFNQIEFTFICLAVCYVSSEIEIMMHNLDKMVPYQRKQHCHLYFCPFFNGGEILHLLHKDFGLLRVSPFELCL